MKNKDTFDITISIVSHGQGDLIKSLLEDLNEVSDDFQVIITLNIEECEDFIGNYKFPLVVIRNDKPLGFGENHNNAFNASNAKWFFVVNPDIRLNIESFKYLIDPFYLNDNVAIVAPLVLSAEGLIEDSARKFPKFFELIKRFIFNKRKSDYEIGNEIKSVDWVAGMFMAFRGEYFEKISGFDDARYFMYMEDADICLRARSKGWDVLIQPKIKVTHLARRASKRNIKHFRWHLVSAFRFLTGL